MYPCSALLLRRVVNVLKVIFIFLPTRCSDTVRQTIYSAIVLIANLDSDRMYILVHLINRFLP